MRITLGSRVFTFRDRYKTEGTFGWIRDRIKASVNLQPSKGMIWIATQLVPHISIVRRKRALTS